MRPGLRDRHGIAFFSPTLDWLVAARIVSGAFAAGIYPMAMAWVGDNVAYDQRRWRWRGS
ncbi:hypothetical protein [Castellaniella defragrans]|uniref:hypothetical protein n=1 Tax=Castellaniella defragrans TaxID=75697 RepID=UPI002AFE8483|nr:hypothetical protein [Castellaniella defragrans]